MRSAKNQFSQVISSLKSVFSKTQYLFIFVILSIVALIVFIYIPIKTIPGNSLELQMSIFTTRDYLVMIILSLLSALFLTMQIFSIRNSFDAKTTLASVGKAGAGGYAGVIGALFATASCASCLFALLGFLGFGTLIFLVNIRWYIVIGTIILLLASIYFSARKINGVCESCRVRNKKIR